MSGRAVKVALTGPQLHALLQAAMFHFAGDEQDWEATMGTDVRPEVLQRACERLSAAASHGLPRGIPERT